MSEARGRDRGPAGLVRAWVGVLVRPRRFFRTAVVPGDQAPGLTFLMAVVLVSETTRFALVAGAYPDLPVASPLAGVFWIGIVVLLVAPLGLHLVAAVATLCLAAAVRERAGTTETVQVIAYSTAPCVVSGLAVPPLRAVAACYGAVLLAVGLWVVHDTSPGRALAASVVPAVAVYGYGFRGLGALAASGVPIPW